MESDRSFSTETRSLSTLSVSAMFCAMGAFWTSLLNSSLETMKVVVSGSRACSSAVTVFMSSEACESDCRAWFMSVPRPSEAVPSSTKMTCRF